MFHVPVTAEGTIPHDVQGEFGAASIIMRPAVEGSGGIADRVGALLEESGRLLREYPHLAAFEWAIRAEKVVGHDSRHAGDSRAEFESVREILAHVVSDAHRDGELGPEPDPEAALEAVYALVYGLTELAATFPPSDFQDSLHASKVLASGALHVPRSRDRRGHHSPRRSG